MALGLIGRKIGMTQIFDEVGIVTPVTLIEIEKTTVVDVFNKETRGYNAIKIGYGEIEVSKLSKPLAGQFLSRNLEGKRSFKEFRLNEDEVANYKIGDALTVGLFEDVEFVDVQSISKGRGFQGVIKKYNFSGGRKTHGSHFHRLPGSIGACASPSKVFKGRKLPGRMGGIRVTVQNLDVVKINKDKNILAVKGAIPGPNGGVVRVTKAVKKKARKAS